MSRRTGIYVRLSQARDGSTLGVDRQREDCEALARRRGWDVHDVYVDNDVSAATGAPRPAYSQLLDDLTTSKIDAACVWSLDRLHRRPVELEHFLDVADSHGVALASVGGDVDIATAAGRLHARIMASVAKHETEARVARTKRAQLQAAQQGRWPGGSRPFGYRPGGVELDPAEAAEIRRLCTAVLGGASLNELARGLNDRGVRTATGNSWSHTQVRQVLLRARNAGLREHQGQVIGPAQWPAIVDEGTWRAVTTILTAPGRRTVLSNARLRLLSGIAVCGATGCGAQMRSASMTNRLVYRCSAPGGGGHAVRAQNPVDRLVVKLVLDRMSAPDAVNLVLGDHDDDVRLIAAAQETAAVRLRLDQLAVDYAAGLLDGPQLSAAQDHLKARLATLESRTREATRMTVLGDLVGRKDPVAAWAGFDLGRRRAVIDALVQVVILPVGQDRRRFSPTSVEITWKL